MKITIIVIGDELLIGQVTDTNSGFIARHVAPEGWEVDSVRVVADDADAIRRAIEQAFSRTDVVLTTGGLGPTKDDITKATLRDLFGGEMIEDPEVLENVKTVFRKRGLVLNELTAAQAIVPSSARIIQNLVGTAPIMWFEKKGKVLVAMPGVPFETEKMFVDEVFPQLQQRFPSDMAIAHRSIIVEGITESDLATLLADWESVLPEYLHLAYLPKPGIIRLRLDGHHPDRSFIEAEIARKGDELIERLGKYFLYDGDKTPAEILLERLTAKGLTVATAESCTGGNIAHELTSIPGSSVAVKGGVVAYCNEVKTNVLGVSRQTLEEFGAVSEPVVRQMAEGARRVLGADCAMATSGIAGPGGATPGKPVGTVCIAVSIPSATIASTFHFPGSRLRVIDRSTQTALLRLLRAL